MDKKILHSRYEENSKCEFHKYKYVDENRIKKPCYCDRCVESYSKDQRSTSTAAPARTDDEMVSEII